MSDLIKRKSIRNMYSCLDPEDKVRVAQVLTDIDAIPSARPKEEWTDVLAELHDRFDALEKEIRKASAEMSAVIREYVDRPKGEWMPYEAYLGKDREYSVTEHKCSLCGYLWGEPEYRYCPNCGADMRPKGDTDV